MAAVLRSGAEGSSWAWQSASPRQCQNRDSAKTPSCPHICHRTACILSHSNPLPAGTPGGLASHPIGDRFVFDLQARTWRQLPIRGMSPLPRWMFASTQFAPTGGGAETFLLFGGQTGALAGLCSLLICRCILCCRRANGALSPPLSRVSLRVCHLTAGPCVHLTTPHAAGAGCNLNDVWRLSLDTYLWTQLSEPRFATKECQHLFS